MDDNKYFLVSDGCVAYFIYDSLKKADASRKATVQLDVKIPFDKDAVKAIFDKGADYELYCAEKYLRK